LYSIFMLKWSNIIQNNEDLLDYLSCCSITESISFIVKGRMKTLSISSCFILASKDTVYWATMPQISMLGSLINLSLQIVLCQLYWLFSSSVTNASLTWLKPDSAYLSMKFVTWLSFLRTSACKLCY